MHHLAAGVRHVEGKLRHMRGWLAGRRGLRRVLVTPVPAVSRGLDW
jgi:hypothetical protein